MWGSPPFPASSKQALGQAAAFQRRQIPARPAQQVCASSITNLHLISSSGMKRRTLGIQTHCEGPQRSGTFHTTVINLKKHPVRAADLKLSHIPSYETLATKQSYQLPSSQSDLLHEVPAHQQGSFPSTPMKSHLFKLCFPLLCAYRHPRDIQHVPASEQAAPARASLLVPEKEKLASARFQRQTRGKTQLTPWGLEQRSCCSGEQRGSSQAAGADWKAGCATGGIQHASLRISGGRGLIYPPALTESPAHGAVLQHLRCRHCTAPTPRASQDFPYAWNSRDKKTSRERR